MMCADQLPHTSCPVCGSVIAYWPQHDSVVRCRRCWRPLVLVPVRLRPCRIYRIVSLVDVVRSIAAGLALLALAALITQATTLPTAILICASAFTLQGLADVGDGLGGLRTNYVRYGGRLFVGQKSRTASVAKCAIGVALLLLAALGVALALP